MAAIWRLRSPRWRSRCTEIARRLEKAHPEAPRYAELLATTLASLGRAQLACGNRAEAARAVREAITVAESAAPDLHVAKPALLKTLLASLDDATAPVGEGSRCFPQ